MSKLLFPWAYGMTTVTIAVGFVNYGFAWETVTHWLGLVNFEIGAFVLFTSMVGNIPDRFTIAAAVLVAVAVGIGGSLWIEDTLLVITWCAFVIAGYTANGPKRGLPFWGNVLAYVSVLFGSVSGAWVVRESDGEDLLRFLISPFLFLLLGYAYAHWLIPRVPVAELNEHR